MSVFFSEPLSIDPDWLINPKADPLGAVEADSTGVEASAALRDILSNMDETSGAEDGAVAAAGAGDSFTIISPNKESFVDGARAVLSVELAPLEGQSPNKFPLEGAAGGPAGAAAGGAAGADPAIFKPPKSESPLAAGGAGAGEGLGPISKSKRF